MNNSWSICHSDTQSEDRADNAVVKPTTILRYQNKEVMRKQGAMGRESLTALCGQYNETDYVPKGLGVVCVADIPTADREAHIRKMAMGIQEGLPLVLSPEENSSARRKRKGNSE